MATFIKEKIRKIFVRYLRYNVIGFTVFLFGTSIYVMAFPTFGAWTWLLANAFGGIVDFSLITVLNKTNKGRMFDSCESVKK